jgi:hypothetical protein
MSSMATEKFTLVVLRQVCLPHYRRPLYETEGADPRFRFLVLADPAVDVPYLSLSEAPSRCEFKIDTGLRCEYLSLPL